jgi:hypothetical protein
MRTSLHDPQWSSAAHFMVKYRSDIRRDAPAALASAASKNSRLTVAILFILIVALLPDIAGHPIKQLTGPSHDLSAAPRNKFNAD